MGHLFSGVGDQIFKDESLVSRKQDLIDFLEASLSSEERQQANLTPENAIWDSEKQEWQWIIGEGRRATLRDNGSIHDPMFVLSLVHEEDLDAQGRPQFSVSMSLRRSQLNDSSLSSYAVNFTGSGRWVMVGCSPENNNQFIIHGDEAGRRELKERFPGILTCRQTRAESMAVTVREYFFKPNP